MKYDRIQEMFRFVTPGLYLLALVLLINFKAISKDSIDAISKCSAIIVLLVPFVGFVVGYFIECLMTIVERLLYLLHVPRPSKVVLNGKCRIYYLDLSLRKRIIDGKDKVNNKEANKLRQNVKQKVGKNETVEKFYYQSIMARHILGAQVLASLYYLAVAGGWSWCHLGWAIGIIVLLTIFWYHQNCVYMKYLFAEYGKLMDSKNAD